MNLYQIALISALLCALCIAPATAADPVVGSWDLSGTTPFLFFQIPCMNGELTLNADGTGSVSGSLGVFFLTFGSIPATDVTWSKVGENTYRIGVPSAAMISVSYDAAADKMSATANTGDYGLPALAVDATASRG